MLDNSLQYVSIDPGFGLAYSSIAVSLGYKVIKNPVLERKICLVYDGLRPLARPALELMAALRNASSYHHVLPAEVNWSSRPSSEVEIP